MPSTRHSNCATSSARRTATPNADHGLHAGTQLEPRILQAAKIKHGALNAMLRPQRQLWPDRPRLMARWPQQLASMVRNATSGFSGRGAPKHVHDAIRAHSGDRMGQTRCLHGSYTRNLFQSHSHSVERVTQTRPRPPVARPRADRRQDSRCFCARKSRLAPQRGGAFDQFARMAARITAMLCKELHADGMRSATVWTKGCDRRENLAWAVILHAPGIAYRRS